MIDPVAGSGSSIIAAINTNRSAYGFEIKKNYYKEASRLIEQARFEREAKKSETCVTK